jgi:uncharacterized membrane protein YidH (DUF202 family)
MAGTKSRLTPVKVEPKTFFANERTFIQWLSAALLLFTVSVGRVEVRSFNVILESRTDGICIIRLQCFQLHQYQ